MGQVVCAKCGHENETGFGRCVKCSAPLPIEDAATNQISTQTMPDKAPLLPSAVMDMPDETVIFYFLGSKEPLRVQPRPEIVIGRAVMGETESVVDLTPFGAVEKGVSRRHAKLMFADSKYQLVDLESTNGTWVNEQKLKPNEPQVLRSTDMVRFGNLQLFVYFKPVTEDSRETEGSLDQAVARVELAWPVENLTPTHLVKVLGPFLEAVAELQQLRDEVLSETDPKPVVLHSISVGPPISVEVENATPALELASLILATLRDEKLVGGERETAKIPFELGADAPRVDLSTKSLVDSLEVEITRRRLIQIAHQTLNKLSQQLEEPDRTEYVIRMLDILKALEKSELSILAVSK